MIWFAVWPLKINKKYSTARPEKVDSLTSLHITLQKVSSVVFAVVREYFNGQGKVLVALSGNWKLKGTRLESRLENLERQAFLYGNPRLIWKFWVNGINQSFQIPMKVVTTVVILLFFFGFSVLNKETQFSCFRVLCMIFSLAANLLFAIVLLIFEAKASSIFSIRGSSLT